MSSNTTTTAKNQSSYEVAKKTLIESKLAKRPRAESHATVEDGDFEFFKKGLHAFHLPACPPKKELLQLDLAENTPIVCPNTHYHSCNCWIFLTFFSRNFFSNFFIYEEIFCKFMTTELIQAMADAARAMDPNAFYSSSLSYTATATPKLAYEFFAHYICIQALQNPILHSSMRFGPRMLCKSTLNESLLSNFIGGLILSCCSGIGGHWMMALQLHYPVKNYVQTAHKYTFWTKVYLCDFFIPHIYLKSSALIPKKIFSIFLYHQIKSYWGFPKKEHPRSGPAFLSALALFPLSSFSPFLSPLPLPSFLFLSSSFSLSLPLTSTCLGWSSFLHERHHILLPLHRAFRSLARSLHPCPLSSFLFLSLPPPSFLPLSLSPFLLFPLS
jgi:hypothetical protein